MLDYGQGWGSAFILAEPDLAKKLPLEEFSGVEKDNKDCSKNKKVKTTKLVQICFNYKKNKITIVTGTVSIFLHFFCCYY